MLYNYLAIKPTFKSVDKMLKCDHLKEAFKTILSFGAVCFSAFCKQKFGILSSPHFRSEISITSPISGNSCDSP